ncbi:hypothetical protein Cha6605_4781 [Chamaesiphon minutus PCC 6605]|uniref:Uncharacterized protein n=1 Tax=Chamaesiphon minutus (strain ATCC 27169 / PCC 6605) TaxID=1173020 RepID=K9UMM6_CHAP6|nr:hypothetical protein Cha6605_4781 [Chamaesiphon minutus PCC 6605]
MRSARVPRERKRTKQGDFQGFRFEPEMCMHGTLNGGSGGRHPQLQVLLAPINSTEHQLMSLPIH